MAGTKDGVRKTRERHGDDFYKKIGAKGVPKKRRGGFSNPELAREAGKKGRRTPPKDDGQLKGV